MPKELLVDEKLENLNSDQRVTEEVIRDRAYFPLGAGGASGGRR